MLNNDILRRLRYTFDFSDSKMIALFAAGGLEVTRAEVSDWLKRDDEPDHQPLSDTQFAIFLNGLINDRRGKREGAQPEPEKRLNNNLILTKLKIALALQSDDMMAILGLAGFKMSAHELSALFRKSDHKHYRLCKDQVMRNFLHGLQIKYRDGIAAPKQ